jgi:Tfp pilus assembly protein PilN
MFNNTHIAMDITNSDIRVVAYQGSKIKKWLSSPIPTGLIKDGVIQDPQAMSVVIDTLFYSLKLKRKGILCTLTGLPFLYRVINMPGNSGIRAEAIQRAARAEMSVAEEDIYLAWQAVAKQDSRNETDYFVAGVPRTALDPLLEALAKAKIKPARIEMKPLALARAASFENAVVVSLEKEFFDIVLVFEGLVRVIHSFGNAVAPGDIIGLVNEMVDGLNIAIKSYNRDFPHNVFPADTPIFVAGQMASGESVPLLVQEATGHPVSLLQPTLPIPASLPPELYAASLGLVSSRKHNVQQGHRYYDIGINLLEGLRKRSARKFEAGYALAAAAGIILVVLLFKVYSLRADAREEVVTLETTNITESKQLTTYQKSAEEAEALKKSALGKYQSLEDDLKALKEKNQTVANLKSDYASGLGFVLAALPDSMAFESIALEQNTIILQGIARENLDVLTLSSALEQNKNFSEARVKTIAPLKDIGVSFQIMITRSHQN